MSAGSLWTRQIQAVIGPRCKRLSRLEFGPKIAKLAWYGFGAHTVWRLQFVSRLRGPRPRQAPPFSPGARRIDRPAHPLQRRLRDPDYRGLRWRGEHAGLFAVSVHAGS